MFMFGCIQAHYLTEAEDGLYIYQLSGDPKRPLSHSVMLELPRWDPEFDGYSGCRELTFNTGSWNEDIHPGTLSKLETMRRRVTVIHDEFTRESGGYSIFYVLRNDKLLDFLKNSDGKHLAWKWWGDKCTRIFEGTFRGDHRSPSYVDMYVPLSIHTLNSFFTY